MSVFSITFAVAQSSQQEFTNPNISTYFSIVHPIVSFSDHGTNYNFRDNYTVGFPIGINFLKSKKIAFSIEFVPSVVATSNSNKMNGLLFHPGVIYRNIGGFNLLTRLAFDTNGRYGFTCIVNRPIIKQEKVTYFMAMPIPIRFGNDQPVSLTVGLQFGLSF